VRRQGPQNPRLEPADRYSVYSVYVLFFNSTPVQILTPDALSAEKENTGVDMLEGHDARIIGLQVIDKYACLISAATDKTIRLWDLTTYMPLVKLVDTYTHRPVHRAAYTSSSRPRTLVP
jgi:hypothetical protein